MFLVFKNRYGFLDNNNNRYIGYIYEEVDTSRKFSVATKVNSNVFYINEIDESFSPTDNTYSTLTARSLDESKNIIEDILEGKR